MEPQLPLASATGPRRLFVTCSHLHPIQPLAPLASPKTVSADSSLRFLSSLSAHALDTTLGRPASDLSITLYRCKDSTATKDCGEGDWEALFTGKTDSDGRVAKTTTPPIGAGLYRARFDTKAYFEKTKVTKYLYPFVDIVFQVEPGQHYHIPLLISPHGYSTYRGS